MIAVPETLQENATQYEELLRIRLSEHRGFDLVVIGVGPDGHVCSLFPNHALLDEESRWVRALDDAPKPPPHRLTLTLVALGTARHVMVVALGSSKAACIAESFQPNSQLPLARVLRVAQRTTLFLDQSAAARLA